MGRTLGLNANVVTDVPHCESPGPFPLAIIIRPTMIAATAVAAKIVRNQKRRLPRSTKSFAFPGDAGLARPGSTVDFGLDAVEGRSDSTGLFVRR